jgi:Fe-S-cluster containining protein
MNDEHYQLLAAVYHQTLTALHGDIAKATTAENLLNLAQAALQHTSQTVEQVLKDSQLPTDCAPGCSFCCWLRIDAQVHEVLLIARFITAHATENELLEIRKLAASRLEGVTPGDTPRHSPCSLLKDGHCQVYPVRPGACRRYFSQSVAACQRLWDDIQAEATVQYVLIADTGRAVGGAVNHAFAAAGFDPRYYELTAALMEALSDPECETRWLRREKVFAIPGTLPPTYRKDEAPDFSKEI